MAAISLRCPDCEAILKVATRPAKGRKVTCPECETLFVASDNESPKSSTAVKTKLDRPVIGAKGRAVKDDNDDEERPSRDRRSRADDEGDTDDDDRPGRSKGKQNRNDDRAGKKKPASKSGLIVGLCVGAGVLLLGLVLVGGGVFWWLAKDRQGPIAKGPDIPAIKDAPVGPDGKPKPPIAGPVELTDELKTKTSRATMLVRVDIGNQSSTGSGFLVKSSGDTAYIITNFHVIAVEQEEPAPPKSKGKGGPKGPPTFLKGPKGGTFGPFAQPSPQPKAKPKVSVVINSGTAEEQTLIASVVAIDEEADLAALRVTGARNLPQPIDVNLEAAVAETLPIFTFGFPVKDRIPGKPGNPTITTGKGTISGLRRDVNNELTDIHINGELNPGNSGGPVIDGNGRLVGIAVATVPGKQIGFVIPAGELNQMFKGRLSNAIVFQLKQQGTRLDALGETWVHDRKNNVRVRDSLSVRLPDIAKGDPPVPVDQFMVMARLSDPMLKVGTVSAYFAVAEDALVKPNAQGWAKIANAAPVALKIQDQTAVGSFKLPNGAFVDDTFAFQFSYVYADAQTIFTQPHPVRLTFPKNPKSVTLNITAIPDVPTRRFIEDTAPKQFEGKFSVVKRDNLGLTIEIDPVADPKTIAPKINFGTLKSVQGRTFAIEGKKLDLPLPNPAEVDAALADLKATDGRRRITAADQLAKAYAPLPERRAEVAKALEVLVNEKDGWLGKATLRALLVWGGPENVAGIAPAVDNAFIYGEAFDVLTQFKTPEAAELVAKYLRSSIATRNAANVALKGMGPVAEKAVIPYVANPDPWIATLASDVLKEIGTPECIPALTKLANSSGNFASATAREALKSVQARAKGAQ
ncbi:MAG: hypothetical protein EXS16_14140 [Gemmataceae bacterium]|nr:hypothetical protein [Gemmataceae bacterium]